MKTALVVGSTGLTGTVLQKMLLADSNYHQVFLIVRQSSNRNDGKVIEHQVDFDNLSLGLKQIGVVDEVFCCLGTTMRKAGSRAAFSKVDYQYPLELAKWCESMKVKKFLCISAIGADPASSIFYNRVKGEMERDISKLRIDSKNFFRPSLILGDREERRTGEKLAIGFAKMFSFLFIGPLKKWKAIPVERIAKSMIAAAAVDSLGVQIYESIDMNT